MHYTYRLEVENSFTTNQSVTRALGDYLWDLENSYIAKVALSDEEAFILDAFNEGAQVETDFDPATILHGLAHDFPQLSFVLFKYDTEHTDELTDQNLVQTFRAQDFEAERLAT